MATVFEFSEDDMFEILSAHLEEQGLVSADTEATSQIVFQLVPTKKETTIRVEFVKSRIEVRQ